METNKHIVLIKIGGSLITNKNKPFSLQESNLDVIVNEIAYLFNHAGLKIILGHGSGSFGHTAAAKHQTQNGLDPKNPNQVLGMAQVKEAATRLNQIIIQRFINQNIPAITLHPDSFMFAENKKPIMAFWNNLNHLLYLPVLPVVYGDVIFDKFLTATIFSTEKVLAETAKLLTGQAYQTTIVHCGVTEGVYDANGKTIPVITPDNFNQVKASITGSAGVDITGGMIHKVKTSLELAKLGITSYITDGVTKGSLRRLLLDQDTSKTTIIKV
ncbi:MAG: hypothetical protein GXP43_01315 [bacterium]|nr:hypothetical protein [bacterium]